MLEYHLKIFQNHGTRTVSLFKREMTIDFRYFCRVMKCQFLLPAKYLSRAASKRPFALSTGGPFQWIILSSQKRQSSESPFFSHCEGR